MKLFTEKEVAVLRKTWPYNFLIALMGDDDLENVPSISFEGLSEVMDGLETREAMIILHRYRDKMSYRAIGEIYNVSGNRIQQIEVKLLRRLRKPYKLKKIRGEQLLKTLDYDNLLALTKENERIFLEFKERYIAMLELLDDDKKEEFRFIPKYKTSDIDYYGSIDSLEFSVRTYNCLKRGGINFVYEVLDLTDEKMDKIRNLGGKCKEEIKAKVAEIKREEDLINELGGK